MKSQPKAYFTIPEWDRIPFLIHGFGSRFWQHDDFQAHPRMRSFEPIYLRQIHSDIIHILKEVPGETLSGDAFITGRHGLLLVIRTADCLPLLIADPEGKAVAAAHCGWRSIGLGLIGKVIRNLEEHFRCDPASLIVALGPCIEMDCYEVGEDVRKAFRGAGLAEDVFHPHPRQEGKFYLDLRMAARYQLLDAGIEDAHISLVNLCTFCEEVLFSYRRRHREEGRMLSFIGKNSS